MGDETYENARMAAVGSYAIVFVSRHIPAGNGSVYFTQSNSMPGVGPYSRFQVAAPGKLIVRETNGNLRTLIDGSNPNIASLNLIDVNAPDVSYDATKIVFAGLPAGSYNAAPLTDPGAWRIYIINVDGTGLRQLTFSDQNNLNLSQFGVNANSFTKYDDTDPAWLPDGRIVFSSTRWPSYAHYGGVRTSNLYIINSDGTNLHRITAERNGADRALVDPITGKIVYARWWRNSRFAINSMDTVYQNPSNPSQGYVLFNGLSVDRNNQLVRPDYLWRNAWHPATINPDGTGLAMWTGSFRNEGGYQMYGGAFTSTGDLIGNNFPMNNMTEAAGFGGLRLYHRGHGNYSSIIGVTGYITQYAHPQDPVSYGVSVGPYASDPAVLPDGSLVVSWAPDYNQDYGLYTINLDGTGRTLLYDNLGTTELRARVISVRPLPPIIADVITQTPSLLPPTANGPYDLDGTFIFDALNVYANAPVDTDIVSAPPVGSAKTIRFFIDHQRTAFLADGSLDWPILLDSLTINPDGSVRNMRAPANVPLFEQIRSADGTVPLTGGAYPDGAAHVAGMNFGRPGADAQCVGCHTGHSMMQIPANPADAQWTNLAPGANVTVSSTGGGLVTGINDRRVKLNLSNGSNQKYWISNSGNPNSQWVKLTFPVSVTVRTVRLYNIFSGDSAIKVLNTTVQLFSDQAGTNQVASATSGALSENGTNVAFNDVAARVVKIQFTSVNGSNAGLGEVEVIARGEGVTSSSSTNANLSNLVLSTGALAPAFTSGTTIYTQSVTNATASLTITPTVADATATVKVKGATVASGSASGAIPLAVGSNIITAVVTAQDGITTRTYTVTVKRASATTTTTTFADVPTSHPYFNYIEILYANGLTGGCSTAPLNFCPETIMDRAQTAVFMMRGNFGGTYAPPAAIHIFGDNWSQATWAEIWAEAMYKAGLTGGCVTLPLKFCPYDKLTRAQVVVFGLRLKYGNAYAPPAASGTVFADMTDRNFWATAWAEKAYADGILPSCGTSGSGKPLFCANDLVSRGFGASIIVKAKNLVMP